MVHYDKDSSSGKSIPQLSSNPDGSSSAEWNQAIYDYLSAMKPVTVAVPAVLAAQAAEGVPAVAAAIWQEAQLQALIPNIRWSELFITMPCVRSRPTVC